MAKTNPFRFSTKYQDDETDLLYYGYRYYNASTGRWLSRDPKGEAGDHNLFAFVRNDPVCAIDWLGLDFIHSVILLPRLEHQKIKDGADGATQGHLASLKVGTARCPCGIRMNHYELRATLQEWFKGSLEEARLDGTLAHEDAHARARKRYYESISAGAKVMYMRCVSDSCFSAWNMYWGALKEYAAAELTLTDRTIEFEDPDYDPAERPTQAQLDAARAGLANARNTVITLWAHMLLKCAK